MEDNARKYKSLVEIIMAWVSGVIKFPEFQELVRNYKLKTS